MGGRGACNSEGGQPSSVPTVGVDGRKACFAREDGGGG